MYHNTFALSMLRSTSVAMCFAAAACLACNSTSHAAAAPTTRPAVVVELFTSEGCSSCPPADAGLAELAAPAAVDGVDVIPMELHVDYWNRLGWADPFSKAAFSLRQQNYAKLFGSDEVYTPQMIVDGTDEFVGSDRAKAREAITRAAAAAKGTISLDVTPVAKDAKSVNCRISITKLPANSSGDVLLAMTEDGLSTEVPRGENAGKSLRHSAVVRSLQQIGTIKPGDPPFAVTTRVETNPTWQLAHLNLVIFVQDPMTGKVQAAIHSPLSAAFKQK
jgi:hypothetical protein